MPPAQSRKALVCLIEPDEKFRLEIVRALTSFYRIQTFAESEAATAWLREAAPALVILDENAPPHGGAKTLASFRHLLSMAKVPILCVSDRINSDFLVQAQARGMGALAKPVRRSVLIKTISGLINRKIEAAWETIEPVQQAALKQTVTLFNDIADLVETGAPVPYPQVRACCQPLAQAVENAQFKDILRGVKGHDNYSYVHSLRVAVFLAHFGATLGMRGEELLTLASGGLLHDIGKMAIPFEVLNKPGILTPEEFALVKTHVQKAVDMLCQTEGMSKSAIIVARQHHEKLDGSGYPQGLKNGQLNELARMASIVDIFGALTDRRPYKDPIPPEEALAMMAAMKHEIDQNLLGMFRGALLDAAREPSTA